MRLPAARVDIDVGRNVGRRVVGDEELLSRVDVEDGSDVSRLVVGGADAKDSIAVLSSHT